jgi:hypothetical protein
LAPPVDLQSGSNQTKRRMLALLDDGIELKLRQERALQSLAD